MLNGVAWLQSGLADQFLVGGSEAPLTPFTIAQMKALKIYASNDRVAYPCQAMNWNKKRNSMFLGEGAAIACLEKGVKENALALIGGIGYATEPLKHNISISTEADCFQKSIKMALGETPVDEVDAVVLHAPGTAKGDLAEYNAIKAVFKDSLPALTTNKWKIGHTFGASGILSLELAVLMLRHQEFIPVPFVAYDKFPKQLNKIIVNAVGFGGNAVSILLERL
jgi:3-oxoacyl-(acyl-carrier-protein) synthase